MAKHPIKPPKGAGANTPPSLSTYISDRVFNGVRRRNDPAVVAKMHARLDKALAGARKPSSGRE